MASTAAERKIQQHQRYLEKGLKRRAFYITDEDVDSLRKYKVEIKARSLDEALSELIKAHINTQQT